MAGYKHLTHDKRYKIEALLKAKVSVIEIAKQLGCSRGTIYYEIKRGQRDHRDYEWRSMRVYDADVAQRDYNYKATSKGTPLKIGNDYAFVNYVEHMILDKKYSPDAIIGRIKKEGLKFSGMVCTRTLYNYIDEGNIFPNVTRESLHLKGKRTRKYDKVSHARSKKPLQRNIEDRPKEINSRSECGHWEMDTVIGKSVGKNEVLLVLTERKSRLELIRKIPNKTQDAVISALNDIERKIGRKFSKTFKSITMDNGCEFLNDEGIEHSIKGGERTRAYYCHPYNSCERGSNENANKIIRRFVPKGESINQYSKAYISKAQNWMNNYPRKILDYSTPLEVFRAEMGFII